MLRYLLLGTSALSIAAMSWVWVRSYRTLDELSGVSGGGVIESVLSFRGGLHLGRSGNRAADRGWSWDAYTIPPGTDWDSLYFSGTLEFRGLGFGWLRGKPFNAARPFGNTPAEPLVTWLNVPPYNAVVVPYWFVIVLLATPWWWPVAWRRVLSPLLARFRRSPWACRRCGYDLRATPERCPECGTVPRRKPIAPPSGVAA